MERIHGKTNEYDVITEQNGLMEKGSGINFVVKNNRQKFELNKRNVESHQLKVSANLETLAISVQK